MSTAARVVSMSCDFDDSVLASRFSSCIRKSRRRPAGSSRREGLADLGDVAAQAIDFLVDVESLRENGELLFEPFVIDFADQLRDALEQFRAHAGAHLRQPLGDPGGEFQQSGAALFERLLQAPAFAVAKARRAPAAPRRAGRARRRASAPMSRVVSRTTPGQRSRSMTSMRAAAPDLRARLRAARWVKAASSSRIDLESARGDRRRDKTASSRPCRGERTADTAARNSASAHAEFLGQAAANFEKSVIDRLQFPGEHAPRKLALAARKAGHATDHRGFAA